MNQKTLAKWLKGLLIGAGVCGTFLYFLALPHIGQGIVYQNPEFSHFYWPWQIFLWLTAIPCYGALICCYRVASEVGKDNSFSEKNAKLLKAVALWAAIDSAFLFTGNLVLLFLNMNHPSVMLLSFLFSFAGTLIAVAAAALSHLVYKAAKLREESELTI